MLLSKTIICLMFGFYLSQYVRELVVVFVYISQESGSNLFQ